MKSHWEIAMRPIGDRKRNVRRALMAVACFLLVLGIAAVRAAPQQPVAKLPVLTTARQAHSLEYSQAALAYPVHLRGVVTFFDPYQEGQKALFIADQTGGIFIKTGTEALPPIHAGSILDVTGATDPGGYAPIVFNPRIRVIPGVQPLPNPQLETLPSLMMGTEDGQWVAIRGIVHSVELDGTHAVLTVATDTGTFTATTLREEGFDYSSLADSQVLLQGVAAPLVDAGRRMVGVRILFPGLRWLKIEQRGSADPFALPIQPLGHMFRYLSQTGGPHRIHVQGKVTLFWPGQTLCIMDASDGLCARTSDRGTLNDGELVDVVGFPALDNYRPTLLDVTVRPVRDGASVAPILISAENSSSGDHDGKLVRMEGKLIGRSWTQERSILLLSSERILFSAVLPPGAFQREEELASRWPDGSTVTVTGVFSGNVDRRAITRREGVSQLESFQILLRSPEDVTVVAAPTWWNSRHTLMVIGSMAVLTLGILCWVVVLRHQVHQQTRIIRADEEKFRYLAQHDPLTGLFVRTVLLERLEQEIHEAALNTSSLALLMVDVDGFKQLNDSMGHAAGDEVLVSLAGRIQRSVRESDTVARMGGDEFMALLPKMHGIQDAERVAAQLVRSISVPFIVGGNTVAISVSVGVTAYPEGGTDSKSLIHRADAALYRAKALGRNRYQLFGEDNRAEPDPFEPRTRLQ